MPNLYTKFINFQGSGGQIANAEQLILAGLFCHEEKVRQDFAAAFESIAIKILNNEQNPLNYVLGLLAKNFSQISSKPSRQFFDLFNSLIDLKAHRDSLDGVTSDASAIYNPEDLLSQIIDKIKAQQRQKQESASAGVEETEEDEVKAMEIAAEQERLLVGLITLTGKIIAKADKAVSDRII